MSKKIINLVSIVLIIAVMAGCNNNPSESSSEPLLFGFSCMDLGNPFYITLEASLREEVEKDGNKMISLDPSQDLNLQIEQINEMIAQDIDLLFLCPVEGDGITPVLEMCKEAGIPVVNFDASVAQTDLVNAVIGSDNYHAGELCAEDLVKRMPGGGEIAIIDSPGSETTEQRVEGFKSVLEKHGDSYKVVAQIDGKKQISTSNPLALDMIESNPEIDAFFGCNDPTALGVMAALQTAGKENILIYGVDGSPEVKTAIKSGHITGSSAQSPDLIGKKAHEVAMNILNDEPYEKDINVDVFFINSENVDEYGTNGWQ